MKLTTTIRFFIIALLVSLASGWLCTYFYQSTSPGTFEIHQFQKKLNEKEKTAVSELQKLRDEFNPEVPDSTLFDNNSKGIAYYIYNQHGLIFWTDNHLDISSLCVDSGVKSSFVELTNASCVYKSVVKDSLIYVALITVKDYYPMENELLSGGFESSFRLPKEFGIKVQPEVSENRINDISNNYLFSVTESENPVHNNTWAYAGIISFCVAFLFFFLIYANAYRFFKSKFTISKYLIVFSAALVITGISLYFNIPDLLYWSGFFSPFDYASNAFLASIIHLSIVTAFLFTSVYLLFFRVSVNSKKYGRSQWLLSVLFPVFFMLVYYMLSGLIFHSSFRLDILHFEDFTTTKVWIHFLVLLWGASLVLLFYKARNKQNFKNYLLKDIVGFVVVLLPAYFVFENGFKYFVISYALLLVSFYVPLLFKKQGNIYYLMLWWIFVYVNLFVWNTLVLGYQKKTEKYQAICRNIFVNGSSGNDGMADILLEDLNDQIVRDTSISRMTVYPDSVFQANTYINQTYLRGFWNKYDMRLNVAKTGSDQYEAYQNYIFTVGTRLKNTNFYSVPASFNDMSYLGIFPVKNADSLYFFMEFFPRKNFKSYSFPNLFVAPVPDIQTQLEISTAKYDKGQLLFSSGPIEFPENITWIEKRKDEFYRQKINHRPYFIYHPTKDVYIVLAEQDPVRLAAAMLYRFYTMIIFFFVCMFFTWMHQLSRRHWKIRIGLTAKFQYSFILLLIVSFVGIFYVSVNFIRQKYQDEQALHIETKKKYIQKELQNMYYWSQNLSAVNQQTLNFDLQELSYKYQTDIHVYDNNGVLIGSSQPLIFSKNLISRLISPRPFFSQNANMMTNENIGKLNYLVGYTDFYNGDYLQIGYIAVPQYFSQAEIRKEIEGFLSAIIHIYLFIIILVVLLSLFIGKQLSAPLNMLQQKLQQMRFGQRNEKIDYTLNDEIGQLVKQYNKTLDELERSAHMLAQSERESAWKTMARQIAHEINNPLTPMKLTIQQLQRTYSMQDERFDDYFRKSTKTLIEQIDNLSRIAATFSNFARMPEANFVHMDVAERLHSVVQLFVNSHENLQISYHGSENGIFVFADPEQLTQVFNNLLKNAIQSIPSDKDGMVNVSIATEAEDVVIEFTDNGSGIPDEIAEKLFTPNFTTKSTGMGLGLTISKNIVEISGGKITFRTQANEGTSFTVVLPIEK